MRVGREEEAFHIHAGLLARSIYFSKAIANRKYNLEFQLEGYEKCRKAAATFTMYVHFLYYGTVPCKVVRESELRSEDDSHREEVSLVRLYIMAQRVGDISAMDAAMTNIISVCSEDGGGGELEERLPRLWTVQKAYSDTPPASPLRRLMVDMCIRHTSPASLDGDSLPDVFKVDVAKAALGELRKLDENYPYFEAEIKCCDYHQHQENTECSSRKRKRGVEDDDDIEGRRIGDDSRTADDG